MIRTPGGVASIGGSILLAPEIVENTDIYMVPIERLRPNPRNTRTLFLGIRDLADSIHSIGLLQNLIATDEGDKGFIVRAGNRRLKAIQMLAKEGKWKGPVPCLIVGQDISDVVNLAENTAREDVPVWHLGSRLNELKRLGLSQAHLAQMIGKSACHVSQICYIAEGIHPDLYPRLDRMQRGMTTMQFLRTLSRLRTKTDKPDLTRQTRLVDGLVKSGKKPRKKRAPNNHGREFQAQLARRVDTLLYTPGTPEQRKILAKTYDFLTGRTETIDL